MKHRRIRTAAIAASTLGMAVGATLVAMGGAQAAVRPDVQAVWLCQTLSGPYGTTVYGSTCTGGGAPKSGVGWFEVPSAGGANTIEYLCRSFTYSLESSDYYSVTGSSCTPYE
jgi:hypothetical protein